MKAVEKLSLLGESPLESVTEEKIVLLALVPVLLFAVVLSGTASRVLLGMAEKEVAEARGRLLQENRSRLVDYAYIARSQLSPLYAQATESDMQSRAQAVHLLSAIKYGEDGYFFGYDSDVLRIIQAFFCICASRSGLTHVPL